MTPFVAALLGLGISQGAYTAEVVRAGLLSVDLGQYEAAQSIGMTRLKMLRRIVMPQAMRVIVPPVGNEFIGMVKLTSLASVIQYAEILHNAQNIYYANTRVIELLIVAAIWYLDRRHDPQPRPVLPRAVFRPRAAASARRARPSSRTRRKRGLSAATPLVAAVDVAQALRRAGGAERRLARVSRAARSSASSGRPARARARSCAASTSSSASTAARSSSTASSSAIAASATSCTS